MNISTSDIYGEKDIVNQLRGIAKKHQSQIDFMHKKQE